MSLFVLKIIGIFSMFLDHYYFIIGGSRILNIIGRIAFPIFAFALNEGYRHTKNLKLYLSWYNYIKKIIWIHSKITLKLSS